ncbi:hypothetical protein BDC45DRAFT_543989 [Circinella umbellata]|nr:hypothetical protein BDC45DRAFT_543989 [Circinella umbellata]
MNEAEQKVATRPLYTLKNEFIGGYKVVGYTRKSKGEKDNTVRIRFLNLMLEKLKTRSLADKLFVSPKSLTDDPFNQRDKKKTSLTTNCEDLKSFVSSVKEIVIDQILSKNQVRMYTSGELLNNEEELKEFDC